MGFFLRNDILSWIYFILTYSCILSFFHSSLFVFKTGEGSGHRTKLILQLPILILWNSVPFHFFFVEDVFFDLGIIGGGVSSAVALAVYWYSVYSIRDQRFSVIHEPVRVNSIYQRKVYSWVRHPFYSSYLICYLGILLAMPNLIHLTAVGVILAVYVKAALKEQRYFLNGNLSAEYRSYMEKTGMFFPRLIAKKSIK